MAALKALNVTEEEFLYNKKLLLSVVAFHIIPGQLLTTASLAEPRLASRQLKTLLPYNNIGFVPAR